MRKKPGMVGSFPGEPSEGKDGVLFLVHERLLLPYQRVVFPTETFIGAFGNNSRAEYRKAAVMDNPNVSMSIYWPLRSKGQLYSPRQKRQASISERDPCNNRQKGIIHEKGFNSARGMNFHLLLGILARLGRTTGGKCDEPEPRVNSCKISKLLLDSAPRVASFIHQPQSCIACSCPMPRASAVSNRIRQRTLAKFRCSVVCLSSTLRGALLTKEVLEVCWQ